MGLTTFFVNLDRHPERLKFIEGQLARAGLVGERISAVDGSKLPPGLVRFFRLDGSLSDGEIGCAASHLKIMHLMVERGIPAALVLEDDAVLRANLAELVNEALRELPSGWDIVRLCNKSSRASQVIVSLAGGYRLVRYSRIPSQSAGFLLSIEGARKFLGTRQVLHPIDIEIARAWLRDLDVYGVDPPPIVQETSSLPLAITARRGRRHRRLWFWQEIHMLPRRVLFNVRKFGAGGWLRCFAANAKDRVARTVQRLSPKSA